MKLEVIKHYEPGDVIFLINKKDRNNLIEMVHPISFFGEIVEIDNTGGITAEFLGEDGQTWKVGISGDDVIEWFDYLYDMGPMTIGSKYGEDLADNFSARGLFFKAYRRNLRHGSNDYARGDIVFDLDPRAEKWFGYYIANNDHKDVFGVIEYVGPDDNGNTVYAVNYGEDIIFNRYSYQISTIDRFPRKDDPWYDEYTLTVQDHIKLDLLEAGKIEDYKKEYMERLDKSISEQEKNEAPVTNTPLFDTNSINETQNRNDDQPQAPDIPFTYNDPIDDTKYHDNTYCESETE